MQAGGEKAHGLWPFHAQAFDGAQQGGHVFGHVFGAKCADVTARRDLPKHGAHVLFGDACLFEGAEQGGDGVGFHALAVEQVCDQWRVIH